MKGVIHQDDNEERVQFYNDCNKYWDEARGNVKMFDPDNQAAQEGLKVSKRSKSINMDYISVWHNFVI